MKYYVYSHKCPISLEIKYIGKGTKNRFKNIKNRSGKHLSWIKSLAKKNLKPICEILYYFDNENEAFQKEIELIDFYKKLGINLKNGTNGGECGPIMKGSKNHNFGKIHAGILSLKKPIVCLTTNKIFDSLSDASREYGIATTKISLNCKLKTSHTKGLKFRYLGEEHLVFKKKKTGPKKPYFRKDNKSVILIDLCIKFAKINDAVRYCKSNGLKTNRNSIRLVAQGKYKTAAGFKWRFA